MVAKFIYRMHLAAVNCHYFILTDEMKQLFPLHLSDDRLENNK